MVLSTDSNHLCCVAYKFTELYLNLSTLNTSASNLCGAHHLLRLIIEQSDEQEVKMSFLLNLALLLKS